ncbi:MAG: radical SAM protein [Peptococcaceae bacterium]
MIIQGTIGCPHNKCNFCTMYKDKKFQIRKVPEIKEDLDMAGEYYGPDVRTIFFADGNTILMKTRDLQEIFAYANQVFPGLERITVYGSARFIALKSLSEYRALQKEGLKRIHSGMESGDDQVLKFINKGTDSAELIRAGKLVKEAGIELSEYILTGAGGKEFSRQHGLNSAQVINRINPDFIRLRTFLPLPGTVMYDLYKKGEFRLLSSHEALRETRLFIENLADIDSLLLSDHYLNYWNVNGRLPYDQELILKEIDFALTYPESYFRNPAEGHL